MAPATLLKRKSRKTKKKEEKGPKRSFYMETSRLERTLNLLTNNKGGKKSKAVKNARKVLEGKSSAGIAEAL